MSEADSDEALMELVKTRDQAAYAQLVDRYMGPIHTYIYRMCRNHSDADELTQETFLRLWSRATTWKPGQVQLTTWLHRVAHNTCVDAFRRRRPEINANIDPDTIATSDDAPNEGRRLAVHNSIANLPERQRTALVLCQLHGWSNKDAAEVLSVSVDALESLLARARRTLKRQLAVYQNEICT
ncbi:MAG: sigma-70 family RNA polymerase sigma factor [Pseudomonadales bacterium]|nr:sigma-70 family RNA polymerase sigma factor [Pseudomonadales bacterium]